MDNESVGLIMIGIVLVSFFVCWTVCVLYEERSDYEICVSECPYSDAVTPTADCIEDCYKVLVCGGKE